MSSAAPSRRWLTRRTVCFALAVLLPPFLSFLTTHVRVLQHISFSLFFLTTVLIATIGGLAPSLTTAAVAVAISIVVPLSARPAGFYARDIPRDLVLFLAAVMISMISDGRRRYAAELRIALNELRERSDDLVASLNNSKCACWTMDLESGRSPRWFSGSYPIFGKPFRDIERMQSLRSLLHPEDQPRLSALAEQMRTTFDPVVFEYRAPWPNGELHWLEMRGNRIAGPGCRWRGVTVDITERKQAESALLRSQKLAAMGKLASTVAHEINNPLEAVTNLLYLARSSESSEAETQGYLASAERELSRLSNITRLTLGFVRTSGMVADTNVAEVVDEVLNLFQRQMENKNVRLERQYEPGVSIRIAPHELRQIASNLVANATDAVSPANGCIAIRVLREDDGGTAHGVLLVEDNGGGIDEAHLPRIFEPFFSTKHEVGTGIGLWVTKELVEKNGGRVAVTSDKALTNGQTALVNGAGSKTSFRVEFPLIC
jgi:PAS domain S-box-containing protein